jgi:hypothetical protein
LLPCYPAMPKRDGPLLDDPERQSALLNVLSANGTMVEAAAAAGVSRAAVFKYRKRNALFDNECTVAETGGGDPSDEAVLARARSIREHGVKVLVKSAKAAVVEDAVVVEAPEQAEELVETHVREWPNLPPPIVKTDATALARALVSESDEIGPTVAEVVDRIWAVAMNDEHRACAKALGLICQFKLAPFVAGVVRASERAAQIQDHAERVVDSDAIDVQVVQRPPGGIARPSGVVIVALPRKSTHAPERGPSASGVSESDPEPVLQ